MKILAIGNSFSTDATTYLERVAHSANEDLLVRNCFIGGCSLKTHVKNSKTLQPFYEYQKDGAMLEMIDLKSALLKEDWDVITLQQASHHSGKINSYKPYLGQLIRFVHQLAPKARIVFHRTWAYEINSPHPNFYLYHFDQKRMFKKIKYASGKMAKKFHLSVIPTGDVVQKVRALTPFKVEEGGLSLNRDGFHLSFDYGRYLASLVWFRFLTGKSPLSVTFAPENTNPEWIELLKQNS